MKRRGVWGSIFLVFMFAIPLSFAAVTLSNHSIERIYNGGESIRGSIVINISNVSSGALLSSNLAGNITLLNFLLANTLEQYADYNCSTANCQTIYRANAPASTFALTQNTVLGLRFVGTVSEIQSATFELRSDAPASCTNQVGVDIGAAQIYYIANKHHTNSSCFDKNHGCFDTSRSSYETALLSSTPYCMNITLPAGPAYLAGTTLTNSTHGSAQLHMQLRDNEDYSLIRECVLPELVNGTQEVSCILEHSSPIQKSYFICITQEGNQNADYSIRAESSGLICGTSDGGESYSEDYDLFAQPLEFDTFAVTVNDSSFEESYGRTLSDYIWEYLTETYDTTVCQPECIVPLRAEGSGQQLSISNVDIRYRRGGTLSRESSLYHASLEDSVITMPSRRLFLDDVGFFIPFNAPRNLSFDLFLGNVRLGERTFLTINGGGFTIVPMSAVVGVPTAFTIIPSTNVSSVQWNFGDGVRAQTGASVSHTYVRGGRYTLEATVLRSDGSNSTKTFTLNVSDSAASLPLLLARARLGLENLSDEIASYPSWIGRVLESTINVSMINHSLTLLEEASSEGNESSSDLLSQFYSLQIPQRVYVAKRGTLPLFVGLEQIDTSYIEQISGVEEELSAQNRVAIKESIGSWMTQEYDANAAFEVIYQESGGQSTPLLTHFTLTLTAKNNSGEAYLFLDYPPSEITFKEEYGFREISSASTSASVLTLTRQDIEFAVKEEVGVAQLGAYISPQLGLLVPSIIPCTLESGCLAPRRGMKATTLIILVFLVTFVVYLMLQEWYKRHYESHLFKESNELYNLVNFIYNARVSSLGDEAIARKLKETGWKGEQVSYAFKKIDGRRTGMLEIPIFKFFEHKKVVRELQKRQQKPLDVRFIKRPSLKPL